MSSVVASQTSYSTHCTFHSCTRHQSSSHTGEGFPSPHPLATQGPDCPLLPPVFPSFFLFFFCFFFLRCGTPPTPTPGNDWWSSHLMVYSSHTKHSNYMSSVSCSLAPAQERCLITQSASDPPHTANPPLTFSVHMLTAGFGTTQKIGTGGKPRATQTPHTTGTLPLLT